MIIAMRGTREGDDDPTWFVPGSPLDAAVAPGPLGKERREDLQAWSFLFAVGLTTPGVHPVGIGEGEDPPDRVLRIGDTSWGMELTELTVPDVRRDLARARLLGRSLADALAADPQRFAHLSGRHVALHQHPESAVARKEGAPIEELCQALAQNRGCVGDGVDLSAGFPEKYPNSNGFYGEQAGFLVHVYPQDHPQAEPTVSATAQADIRRSEALAALSSRIQEKDRSPNDVLLISCGMPDARGYACPLDAFIFRFLVEEFTTGRVEVERPYHLRQIALHQWGTAEWVQIYRSPTQAVPWPSAP